MTDSTGAQDPPTGESTEVPIQEATSVTKDGPEGYIEEDVVKESEDDQTKKQNASSVQTTTAVTGSPESDGIDLPGIAIQPCSFGSPFAYLSYQNKHDFFKGLLAKSTRRLFDQIVAEAATFKTHLSEGIALTNAGNNGHFCVLENYESSSTSSEIIDDSDSGDSQLKIYSFDTDENILKLWVFVDPKSAAIDQTNVDRNGVFHHADPKASSLAGDETSESDTILDVHRVQNSKTGEIEYFVLNKGSNPISVNGIGVVPTVRAGPLPDFAVLEIGHFSLFWWRTAAALDYMPRLKRKRDADANDEGSSKKASKGYGSKLQDMAPTRGARGFASSQMIDPSPGMPVFLESKTWLHEYRRRIYVCKKRPVKYTSSVTDVHPPHELPVDKLRHIDVILAIGALWLGLIHAKIDFAYGKSNLFSLARGTRMGGMYAVKGTNYFLMPLLFSEKLQALSPESEVDTAEPLEPVFSLFQQGEREKNQEKLATAGKSEQKYPSKNYKSALSLGGQEAYDQKNEDRTGHFVLAVAEKINRDGLSTIKDAQNRRARVRLRFMDSEDGKLDKGLIRRAARDIVRNSGWLDDTWPSFEGSEECWTEVLGQSDERSGEHTVLNAWAYMLEIPLARSRKRKLGRMSYDAVRDMIRLALRGQLDSLTIRAWMQHSSYALDEPLSQLQENEKQNPDLQTKLRSIHTVALNGNAFNQIIDDMYTHEQAAKQNHGGLWAAVSLPSKVATTGQPGHAPKVATGVTLPPSDQGPSGIPPVTSGIPGSFTGPATTFPLPPPRTWQERLDQGLAYQRKLRAKNPRTTEGVWKNATNIESASDMKHDEVVIGIASVWEGLKRLGRPHVDFTYAGLDLFVPGGGQRAIGAVGGWNRFIIPLFFGPQDAAIIGHLLLCVAELVNVQPMTVQVEVFDSLVDLVHIETIKQKAREIIDDSEWLVARGSGVPSPEVIFVRRPVPRQKGINTCGFSVILNAWATMLDIPICRDLSRCGRPRTGTYDASDEAFFDTGLEIVNLALGGFMDSGTIQAFFNVYGYSVRQRYRDPVRAVIPVNAVGMNEEKFRLTLQKRYWEQILRESRYDGRRFPDEDVASLMDLGLSGERAWEALAITDGDVNGALQWHYDVEEPEDALSPQTPERGKEPLDL